MKKGKKQKKTEKKHTLITLRVAVLAESHWHRFGNDIRKEYYGEIHRLESETAVRTDTILIKLNIIIFFFHFYRNHIERKWTTLTPRKIHRRRQRQKKKKKKKIRFSSTKKSKIHPKY